MSILIGSGGIIILGKDKEIPSGLGDILETTKLTWTTMVITIEVTTRMVPGVEGSTIMETVGGGVRMAAGT